MRGQRVDARTVVDTIATHIGIVPRSLAHGAHAGHDAWRHFRFNSHLAATIKDAHRIAVLDAAFFGIDRIKPDLLAAGRFQHVDVAVARVGTGFEVEAKQLQRELRALGGIPSVKGRCVDGKGADGLILFQLPGGGNVRQPAGVDFNLARWRFQRIGFWVLAEFL